MQSKKPLRFLLGSSSLIALVIGASILFAPAWFHGFNGIELGADPSLLSEVRAPGGALMVLGALMGVSLFVPSFTQTSTLIAAAVYLAYGLSRLLSLGLDGMPSPGLLGATALELAIGVACVSALLRARPRRGSSPSRVPWARSGP